MDKKNLIVKIEKVVLPLSQIGKSFLIFISGDITFFTLMSFTDRALVRKTENMEERIFTLSGKIVTKPP